MFKQVNSFIPVLIVPVLISAALTGCRTAGSPDPGTAQTPVYQESQGLETEGIGKMKMPGEKTRSCWRRLRKVMRRRSGL